MYLEGTGLGQRMLRYAKGFGMSSQPWDGENLSSVADFPIGSV